MEPVIELRDVEKRFQRYGRFSTRRLLHGKRDEESIHALRHVSFEVRRGECVGILGKNGGGKTTLLRIIAGILSPDRGQVTTRGRILPLIELGSGFDEGLTGRDNVYLYGSLLGLPRAMVEANFRKIVDFAGLEEFIDVKLRNYSNGMRLRLAFSTAAIADPDILLVDEILAVGDESFQRRSLGQFQRFKMEGKTLLVVSHSVGMLREFCDRIILVDAGEILADGAAEEVANTYMERIRHSDYQRLKAFIPACEQELVSLEQKLAGLRSPERGVGGWISGIRARRRARTEKAVEKSVAGCKGELVVAIREFEDMIRSSLGMLSGEIASLEASHHGLLEQRASMGGKLPASSLKDELHRISRNLDEKEGLRKTVLDDQRDLICTKLKYLKSEGASKLAVGELKEVIKEVFKGSDDARKQLACLEQMARLLLTEYAAETRPHRRALLVEEMSTNVIDIPGYKETPSGYEYLGGEWKGFWTRYLNDLLQTIRDEGDLSVKGALLKHVYSFNHLCLAPSDDCDYVFGCIRRLAQLVAFFEGATKTEDYIERLANTLRAMLQRTERQQIDLSSKGGNDQRLQELERKKGAIVAELVRVYSPLWRPSGRRSGWGNGAVVITSVDLLGKDGSEQALFSTGEKLVIRLNYHAHEKIDRPMFGIAIHHESGLLIAGPNTRLERSFPPSIEGEGHVESAIQSLPLLPGKYLVSAAVYDLHATRPFDHQYQTCSFRVVEDGHPGSRCDGLITLSPSWEHVAGK